MAEQLMGMKGASRREESRWSALATSSLPVPVSPRMVTGVPEGATRSTSSKSWPMAGSPESIPSKVAGPAGGSPASSRSSVSPSEAGLPGSHSASATRAPARKVPLVEPRSSRWKRPPRRSIRRWRPETKPSSSTTSQPGSLPSVSASGTFTTRSRPRSRMRRRAGITGGSPRAGRTWVRESRVASATSAGEERKSAR